MQLIIIYIILAVTVVYALYLFQQQTLKKKGTCGKCKDCALKSNCRKKQ
ncbi:MAG: FeoB-associated Cys-rich membrane protein [Candidatus Symbiothrix sp.]|nr:FeoB-associated Cys-rich membrane protein [Candidatus Symbiothrix sp.]